MELDTSGKNGAGILWREPQSSPQKNGWLLKSLEPLLPSRTSLSQMRPVMKERASSEISGPDGGNSKYSWGLQEKTTTTTLTLGNHVAVFVYTTTTFALASDTTITTTTVTITVLLSLLSLALLL